MTKCEDSTNLYSYKYLLILIKMIYLILILAYKNLFDVCLYLQFVVFFLVQCITMNQPTEGNVLFVGEGNFSLSSSLVSTGILAGPQVISSALDTCSIIQEAHSLAAANIDFLEKSGI